MYAHTMHISDDDVDIAGQQYMLSGRLLKSDWRGNRSAGGVCWIGAILYFGMYCIRTNVCVSFPKGAGLGSVFHYMCCRGWLCIVQHVLFCDGAVVAGHVVCFVCGVVRFAVFAIPRFLAPVVQICDSIAVQYRRQYNICVYMPVD